MFLAEPVKKSLVGPRSDFYVVKDMYPVWGTGLWRGRERVFPVQLLQKRCGHKYPAFAVSV